MLDLIGQAAVRAVLRDLVGGIRVPKVHWPTLLGSEVEVIEMLVATYPDLRDVPFDDANLIIHNVLNLYVNGLAISLAEWEKIGTHSEEVADAFSLGNVRFNRCLDDSWQVNTA